MPKRRLNLKKSWSHLTRAQQRAVAVLGIANLAVVALLVVLLTQGPPTETQHDFSPLAAEQIERCRYAISVALLDAGHSGLVYAQTSGDIQVQIERRITDADPRSQADAAIWAGLEAVAVAGRDACLDFRAVQVTVVVTSDDRFPLHATARVSLPDLLAWSLGQIDDAELARRMDYRPPAPPASPTGTPEPPER